MMPKTSTPLRDPRLEPNTTAIYRYYAGYSESFLLDAIQNHSADGGPVLDPWNGSGTTTSVAQAVGVKAYGFDANPAMAVVAKARALYSDVIASLKPLAEEVIARSADQASLGGCEPLDAWYDQPTAATIRHLERAVFQVLVKHVGNEPAANVLPDVSSLAAFFYLALFRLVRESLQPLVPSNSTWIRRPADDDRVAMSRSDIITVFRAVVDRLAARLQAKQQAADADNAPVIGLASSDALPLDDASIAHIISSPPYCTRIDYVVATEPELHLLGCDDVRIRQLRDQMIGTPTIHLDRESRGVKTMAPTIDAFLERVTAHRSRASSTYYLTFYLQYLRSMDASLRELRRVVLPRASMTLVVQDSYYKDVHCDVPAMTAELASNAGWTMTDRVDFRRSHTRAAIHPGTRQYRSEFSATESVLLFSAARDSPEAAV